MFHSLTRPFVLIGGIALLIAVLLGTSDQAIEFATSMTALVLDIAKAILTALLGGLFDGGAGAPVDPSTTPPAAG